MAEQTAEHFTRFAAKFCLKLWQEQQEDNWMRDKKTSAIWSIFTDLSRPLSPKLRDKGALSI